MKKVTEIVCGFFLICNLCGAQGKKIKKADRSFEEYSFIDAITSYKELVDNGNMSEEIFEKLGDAYYRLGNYKEASVWYEKSVTGGGSPQLPETLFRYALALKSQGAYDESDKWMQKFYENKPFDHRAKNFDNNKNYRFQIEEYSDRYSIRHLSVNSKESDFAPSLYKGKLIFSSARNEGLFSRNIHPWNNKPFSSLYNASILDNFSFSNPSIFSKELDTKAHESSATFSKDGNILYFTRNNFNKGNFIKGENGMNRLKIYRAIRENEEWKNVMELPFNSDDYSAAHPALSADGKKLYFASDMPGSVGSSDIYYVDIHSDGTYGKPINLGPEINTEGRETFPFVSDSNMLYFSSDGQLGLGGLDIFATQLEDANNNCVVNIGEPINSSSDDFAMVLDGTGRSGYFSSNREGGKGDDDIYYFMEERPIDIKCFEILAGNVRNAKDKHPLVESEVKIYDQNNDIVAEGKTDDYGAFRLAPSYKPGNYKMMVNKEGYVDYETSFVFRKNKDISTMEILLEPEMPLLASENTDLISFLNLRPVLFDFGKWTISNDAKENLNQIATYMRTFPKLKIEIRSHTDSRSSENFNLKLSIKRAVETKAYLVVKGINASRISTRGLGEMHLLNNCNTRENCSEDKQRRNRRSEIIVVK
jgi:outer membrane protein OmpA-like peptidoglycan-associated protein/tetratricopeptide (TPR) repeat protein